MSLYEFQTHERIGGQTIAKSKAEVSNSGNYALWIDEDVTESEDELHFLRLDREYIPDDDEALIETVYERVLGGHLQIGNDGHAAILLKGWEAPDGTLADAEDLKDRLLEVL